MVDFGKKLLEKRVEGWEEYYIDYGRLKSLIKKANFHAARQRKPKHASPATTHRPQAGQGEGQRRRTSNQDSKGTGPQAKAQSEVQSKGTAARIEACAAKYRKDEEVQRAMRAGNAMIEPINAGCSKHIDKNEPLPQIDQTKEGTSHTQNRSKIAKINCDDD